MFATQSNIAALNTRNSAADMGGRPHTVAVHIGTPLVTAMVRLVADAMGWRIVPRHLPAVVVGVALWQLP
jgi:hypothetical protein